MTPHIAVAALRGENPKHGCRDCGRTAPWCRGGAALNGADAAHEFTRHLRPPVRARVLTLEPQES